MPERIFGEIPGQPIGTFFDTRLEVSQAGLHRPTVAGISGTPEEGSDSIVLSGGYEDDEDYGDLVVYTGHQGRDQNTGKQVADQELTKQNLALAVSSQRGLPVRVIRGANKHSKFAPSKGYRYDGLYQVESYWHEQGAAGFRIWRFRLIRQSGEAVVTTPAVGKSAEEPKDPTLSAGNPTPQKSKSTVTRVIRDTKLSREIKELYDFTCQVCGLRLEGPGGPYAEAAHVRPLGRPHDGPDTADNLICLCPNHHFLFDVGAFGVSGDFTLVGIAGKLTVHSTHTLNLTHLEYHRQHFGLMVSAAGN